MLICDMPVASFAVRRPISGSRCRLESPIVGLKRRRHREQGTCIERLLFYISPSARVIRIPDFENSGIKAGSF